LQVDIPKNEFEQGFYRVGLLITHRHKILGFKLTDKRLINTYNVQELQDLELKATNNINYQLITPKSNRSAKKLHGYVFMEDQSAWCRTFIVLKSKHHKYIYPLKSYKRPDLAARYGVDVLYAGFQFKIPRDKLPEDSYQVGFLITHGAEILGYQLTNKRVYVTKPTDWLTIKLPEETNNIQNYLILNEDHRSFRIKNGWALVEGVSSYQTKTFIVLKSDTEEKIFKTGRVYRTELASKFGNKYLRAGFKFRISKKDLKKGRYKIGIIIVNTKDEKIEGFIYL